MEKVNEIVMDKLKIVVIGPESTGKTTLTNQLAQYYKEPWVEEYARHYIDQLDREYVYDDLEAIARGQIDMENQVIANSTKLVLCDTDLIVIKIWSEHKYNSCSSYVLEQIHERHYDHYLLTGTDIPYEEDPQREHPELRQHFYSIFKNELKALNKSFTEINGDQTHRLSKAIHVIDTLK